MTVTTDRIDAGTAADALNRRHRRVGAYAATGAVAMLALAFASVPLYRMFCQVTGYGGTTQRATIAPDVILDRTITIRFDANVAPGLGWTFTPVENTKTVRIGESSMAYYRATNTSDRVLVGTAAFNVAPDQMGSYFNKLACFCFTEQRLEPGQTVDMPVSFFIDPAMVRDKDAAHINNIVLSYTFFPVENPKVTATTSGSTGKGG